MLRFATIDLQLVVRSSSSCPEVGRKVLLSENVQIKIILDASLLFGALVWLEEGLMNSFCDNLKFDQN